MIKQDDLLENMGMITAAFVTDPDLDAWKSASPENGQIEMINWIGNAARIFTDVEKDINRTMRGHLWDIRGDFVPMIENFAEWLIENASATETEIKDKVFNMVAGWQEDGSGPVINLPASNWQSLLSGKITGPIVGMGS